MEEDAYPQKLLAEVLGTAMLVFIGVGSVPATFTAGVSIMACKADTDILALWDAPVNTPALRRVPERSGGPGL
jgi:glycerol uptake facilitator protein